MFVPFGGRGDGLGREHLLPAAAQASPSLPTPAPLLRGQGGGPCSEGSSPLRRGVARAALPGDRAASPPREFSPQAPLTPRALSCGLGPVARASPGERGARPEAPGRGVCGCTAGPSVESVTAAPGTPPRGGPDFLGRGVPERGHSAAPSGPELDGGQWPQPLLTRKPQRRWGESGCGAAVSLSLCRGPLSVTSLASVQPGRPCPPRHGGDRTLLPRLFSGPSG